MKRLIISLVVCAWATIGVINAGCMYAHWQRKYPSIANEERVSDTINAITVVGILGPLSTPGVAGVGGYDNGWLMPGTRDEHKP